MNLHLNQIQDRLIRKMKNGQLVRTVYFGSSNTQRHIPGMHWGDWLELACKRTYGALYQAFNAGVGGETSTNLLGRVQRDVIDLSPAAVIITIGGNDACQDMPADTYRSNLLKLHERATQAGILVIFQTYFGCDMRYLPAKLSEFMRIMRQTAQATESPLIDHFERWAPLIRQEQYVNELLMDPLHTRELGNLVMGLDLANIFGCGRLDHPNENGDMMKYAKRAYEIQCLLDTLNR